MGYSALRDRKVYLITEIDDFYILSPRHASTPSTIELPLWRVSTLATTAGATNRSCSSKPWRPTWLLDFPGTHMSIALTTLPNDIDREHGRATRTALELARRMSFNNEKRDSR